MLINSIDEADMVSMNNNKVFMARLRYIEKYLEKANQDEVPIFERLKYIAIFTDKLNNFLSSQEQIFIYAKNSDTFSIQLEYLRKLNIKRDRYFQKITEALRDKNIIHQRIRDIEDGLKSYIHNLFYGKILPELNIFILDENNDLPFIKSEVSYITAILRANNEESHKYLIAEIPMDQDIIYTRSEGIKYIMIEDILLSHINTLAIPYEAEEAIIFSLTKSLDKNLPIKLEISGRISNNFKSFFSKKLSIDKVQIFESLSGVSFKYVNKLENILNDEQTHELTYPKIIKKSSHIPFLKIEEILKNNEIISLIPFEPSDISSKLLIDIADNHNLIEIRGTTNDIDDNFVFAVENALKIGVRVNLMAELKEGICVEKIIPEIIKMENLGANIYYSSTKSNINFNYYQLLYTDDKSEELRTITYFSTGSIFLNNEDNNKVNLSFLSGDRKLSKELASYFDYLSGVDLNYNNHKENDEYSVILSGDDFFDSIIKLIDNEKRKGSKGRIFIKVKNLTNIEIIKYLIMAADSDVQIKIITSGANLLNELNIKAYKNIHFKEIIGQFDDEMNIYLFGSKEDERLFISSADFDIDSMKNYELAIILKDKIAINKVKNILNLYYKYNIDTVYAKLASEYF